MCFGAAASVWNFNRAGDAVQLVVRALLADSAFETFGGIFGDLGLQTKPSKAQPPANEQVIRPRPPRRQRRHSPTHTAPRPQAPGHYSRGAGQARLPHGAVGRAAIQPIHKRAARRQGRTPTLRRSWCGGAPGSHSARPKPPSSRTRSSSTAAVRSRRDTFPTMPAGTEASGAATVGAMSCRSATRSSMTSAKRRPGSSTCSRNARPSSTPEILAQVLAIATFAARLPPLWTAYIDNVAGQCALGLRQQRRRQRHGGGHVGAGSRTGVGTPLRADAVGRQHFRRPLPRRRRRSPTAKVDEGPHPPGRDPPDPLPGRRLDAVRHSLGAGGAGQHRLLSAVALWGWGRRAGAECAPAPAVSAMDSRPTDASDSHPEKKRILPVMFLACHFAA